MTGVELTDYLNSLFPGQVEAGFVTEAVTTIEIGNVDTAPFVANSVTPDNGAPGATTVVTIAGAGFVNPSPIRMVLVEVDGFLGIEDGLIRLRSIDSGNSLTAEVVIFKDAVPRLVEIRVTRGIGDDAQRLEFEILP